MLRLLISICGCSLLAGGTMPAAGHEAVAIGVNVANPQRLSPGDQDAVLDQLQAAGVRVIRAPLKPPWGGDNYTPAIEFIRRAHERGIKVELIVHLEYGPAVARRRIVEDMPEMWPSYPLSSADPARFGAVFEPLFNRLEGLGITFAALELGNEINGSAFNGDFPVPGKGLVFGQVDLVLDPEAAKIAEGYRAYVQTLSVLKEIRDRSRLNRDTPILSAGLADPGLAGLHPRSKTDAVEIGATLQYLRSQGIDALVDAYGVHSYPWANTSARRLNQLEQDTLAECRAPAQGKPCWVTEWGLPTDTYDCPGNDMPRARLTREMLADFGLFVQQGRLKGLMYYAWTDDKYGVYRCGALAESGRLILKRSTLE
jgi:hypothetical protein